VRIKEVHEVIRVFSLFHGAAALRRLLVKRAGIDEAVEEVICVALPLKVSVLHAVGILHLCAQKRHCDNRCGVVCIASRGVR
jgi:hypothetical protein